MSATPHFSLAQPQAQSGNRFFSVQDSGPFGDNSCVLMNQEAINFLKLSIGDTVILKNPKNRQQTLGIVFQAQNLIPSNTLQINHTFRKNLCIEVGERILIMPQKAIIQHDRVVFVKISGSAPIATSQDHDKICLIQYFQNVGRPLCRNNYLEIKSNLGVLQFMVTHTQPSIYGIVGDNTLLAIDRELI